MKGAILICFCVCVTALFFLGLNNNPNDPSSTVVETGYGEVGVSTVTSCLFLFYMFPAKIRILLEPPIIERLLEEHEALVNNSFSLIAAYGFESYTAVTIGAVNWFKNVVFCRYLDNDWKDVHEPIQTVVYPKHAVYCCKRPNATHMSVTGKLTDKIVEAVPIREKMPEQLEHTLSLCLPPLFGNESKWLMLAEMVEHYRLQGVDYFYFYVKEIDDYSAKLMMSYVDDGVAEVVFIRADEPGKQLQYAGVQDCLQRTTHRSRYAIFADLDERIIPVGNISLLELIRQEMGEKPHIGMMQFTSRWVPMTSRVPIKYEGEYTLRKHLPSLVFRNTSSIPPTLASAKCIVDPTKVFWLWVHRVKYFFPGYEATQVDPRVAYIRHYRDVAAGDWGKLWMPGLGSFGSWEITNYPETLLHTLYNRVKQKLDTVYGSRR